MRFKPGDRAWLINYMVGFDGKGIDAEVEILGLSPVRPPGDQCWLVRLPSGRRRDAWGSNLRPVSPLVLLAREASSAPGEVRQHRGRPSEQTG